MSPQNGIKINMNKYIVVHAGSRDDYQVALALNEHSMLFKLITEFYAPFDSWWFGLIKNNLPQKLNLILQKRYKIGLPSSQVIISYKALFYALLCRINKQYNAKKDRALGLLAKRISIKYSIPVIGMNGYAGYAFEKNPNHPYILFQFHPHAIFVKKILEDEIAINQKSRTSLLQEPEFASQDYFTVLKKEAYIADNIICASSITKYSLISQGIDQKKIKIIPYGVNTIKFSYKEKEEPKPILKIIFIGSLNQRKGVTYLLDALEGLSDIELIIIGRGIFDLDLLTDYTIHRRIYQNIPHNTLLSLLHEAHCFVLPSLVEGFGLVILEAMATGTPVVASENTVAKDIIISHKNGFLVPIRDADSIKNIILELQRNPYLINKIGLESYKTAQKYTWENFRNKICENIKAINNKNYS
jgi:glycosyltransferase involved in cell wall biosynthesis